MATDRPRILVAPPEADLAELLAAQLDLRGFDAIPAPRDVDLLASAERLRPDAIVLVLQQVHPNWALVDRLQQGATTRKIPVVALALSEEVAAQAQAAPTGRYTVVAPYDLDDLHRAVAAALANLPPAAVQAPATEPVSRAAVYAADRLSPAAREIALRVVQHLREIEPYRSRFPRLSRPLVNGIGVLVGGIINGIRQNLSAEATFADPSIRQTIRDHVALRASQGLGPSAVIRENQILIAEFDRALRGLIDDRQFTALDAFDVSQRIHDDVLELTRIVVEGL